MSRLGWAWILFKFRVMRRAAILAKQTTDLTAHIQQYLERLSRSVEWKARTAYSPIYVRRRQLSGCEKGCTIEDFPHPGRPCYTHQNFEADVLRMRSK